MAANQKGIELVPIPSHIQRPSCSHGPTLLFERLCGATREPRQFFACSAFRDRKMCDFFQWADEGKERLSSFVETSSEQQCSHSILRNRYFDFKKLQQKNRNVCCSCGLLLLEGELGNHKSKGHVIKQNVSLKALKQPSFIFTPIDNNKTFAQYLFSKSTVDFLLKNLEQLDYTHVLCVGTPRIHEAIQSKRKRKETSLTSMLLDLDERYAQLYSPSCFAKYNMFNHHFFEAAGKDNLLQFIKSGGNRTVLVTDPPFGGMVEALVSSFVKLSQMCMKGRSEKEKVVLPIIWFFPYFMENRIISELPGMNMLDYKVDYDNHLLFNNQQKKKGSPVRMFTNISPALFPLPPEEGYWFCESCQRYSSKENLHCKECGACTSKDGTTYVHCDVCMKCVKPSRVHCFKCNLCQLQDHVCGVALSSGCHICGDLSHKRRDCPNKGKDFSSTAGKQRSMKRKGNNSNSGTNEQKKRKLER